MWSSISVSLTATAVAMVTVMTSAVTSAVVGRDICHGQDCPRFAVLNKTDTWELRRYNTTRWVATNATAISFSDQVADDMFHTLFNYLNHGNEKKAKIEMTTPVLTTVYHGAGPNCESVFVMHFMLPYSYWASPLKPSAFPTTYIADIKPMDVFVRQFPGFAHDEDFKSNLESLAEDIDKLNVDVEEDYFFQASYDGPYTFKNRTNEVWIARK